MTDRIEREVLLPAAPEDVWEVVTGPGWLAEQVELQLVPGGEARFQSRASIKRGWIEEATPPGTGGDTGGRLVFWWAQDEEPASRVELELTPAGDRGTRLRIVEGRPLEVMDLVGIPLPGSGGGARGPAMVAAA